MKKPFLVLVALFVSINSFTASEEIVTAYSENNSRYNDQLALPAQSESRKVIKTVSMNLGLLQSPSEVPNFDQRSRLLSQILAGFLTENSPDVMFLQEACDDNPENILTIRSVAADKGYFSLQEIFEDTANYSSSQSRNGLDILIKQSVLEEGEISISDISFFEISRSLLAKLGGYDRGVLSAKIKMINGKTILLGTSHFTPNLVKPTYNQDSTRRKQSRQTGEMLKDKGKDVDYVVFGADLNFSPEFEHKIADDRSLDAKDSVWEGSTKSYPIFLEKSGLIDTYRIVNSDVGYTQDRLLNPMANVSPSTDGEPEQRLDYIWAGSYSSNSSIEINSSSFVFNSPLLDSEGKEIAAEAYEGPLFMSDHFGVETVMTLY